MNKYQEKAIADSLEKYRKVVKYSVKKGIEGNGIRYDDHLRQEAYSEAMYSLIKQIKEGKVIFIAGQELIVSGNKYYSLAGILCKLSRQAYYRLFNRKSNRQVISLDSEEGQTVYQAQDNYRAVTGRNVKQENALFRQFCKHTLSELDNQIVAMYLEGYNSRQIAGEVKKDKSTVNRRIIALAHFVASGGYSKLPALRAR